MEILIIFPLRLSINAFHGGFMTNPLAIFSYGSIVNSPVPKIQDATLPICPYISKLIFHVDFLYWWLFPIQRKNFWTKLPSWNIKEFLQCLQSRNLSFKRTFITSYIWISSLLGKKEGITSQLSNYRGFWDFPTLYC